MKFVKYLVVFLCLTVWIVGPETIAAHGSGTVLMNQIGQDNQVRFEYEATQIIAGESIPIAIEVKSNEEAQEIEWVFFRITDELSQVLWSGNLQPDELIPKIVRMVARFDDQGGYSINLRIKLKNQAEIIRTDFAIQVLPQKSNLFTKWGLPLGMMTGGILLGSIIGAVIWRRKNT